MKKWSRWILPVVLVLALAGTGYWGYTEYRSRQALQNRAESQYQRAFHELVWHIDMIKGQLAQLLVSTSHEQNVLGLATLWRQSFAAQANLGSLPLGLVPLSKTEKLLSDTTDVSFALLNRTAQGTEPLSDDEKKLVQELYNWAVNLEGELSKLSAQVLDQELSWTQVELAAIESEQKLMDNTIVNGFQLAEKRLEEYPEINLSTDFSEVRSDTKIVRGQKEISEEEARQMAQKWWFQDQEQHNAVMKYEGLGDIPTYGLEFGPLPGEEAGTYIDVCKLDGTVVWALKPKTVIDINIDVSEGERLCKEFLGKRSFPEMQVIQVEQEDNTGVYSFVPVQDGVLLYPDQIKLQVALDNGEILGYEGTPYYMNHRERKIPSPALSQEDIRKQVSPLLNVEFMRPALIANPWGKEVLTWEVRGSVEGEKFVIFYNAQNGSEEEITRLTPSPQFQFTLANSP